jgi:hypothetical protein
MIFASPDVASSLRHWELAEYVSEGFVILACAGELVADLATYIPRRQRKHLERWSTILLVVALSVSLKCLVRTNELSGSVIGSLGDKAEDADKKAKVAIIDSSTALAQAKDALSKAGSAEDSLGKAEDESNKAQAAASSALTLARDARQEADSFEKDIQSAKTQAASAESHLAEALQRAADATAELNRLKSPRSLIHVPELVTTLETFKGTEYTFSSVFEDEESIMLLRAIDDALKRAGWKRVKPTHRFPMINVYGDNEDFAVPSGISNGIQISVDSLEPLATLQSLSLDKLPELTRAAVALNLGLSSSLSPPQAPADNKLVDVQKGTSTTVRIGVGRKP